MRSKKKNAVRSHHISKGLLYSISDSIRSHDPVRKCHLIPLSMLYTATELSKAAGKEKRAQTLLSQKLDSDEIKDNLSDLQSLIKPIDVDEFNKLFVVGNKQPENPVDASESKVYDCTCHYLKTHSTDKIHCMVRLNTDLIKTERMELVEHHRKCFGHKYA